MRRRVHAPLLAVLASVLAAGCATAPSGQSRSCESAYQHTDQVLRRALGRYVAGTTGAPPGDVSTTIEQERTRARMDAWSEQHRRDTVASCGSWTEDQYRCVLGAQSAQALAGCGLGDLVSSFTTDVLGSVGPMSPIIAPPP